MGWSSRLFLLSGDDALHRLTGTAYTRMLKAQAPCRVPDFAGQRARLAGVTVETADGIALGVRHMSFSVLEFDADGLLDVQRLNVQQVARLDTLLAGVLGPKAAEVTVVDAANRFRARGGAWEPDRPLRRRLEAAALGLGHYPRVRVVD